MSKKTRIIILGCTGSIGKSTLDIVRQHPDRFELVAVTANTNIAQLLEICRTYRPAYAALASEIHHASLKEQLQGSDTNVVDGPDALTHIASMPVDIVVAGMVGASGVRPIMSALQAGSHVALANKEALVCAGPQVLATARMHNARLLPVDSEHNAIFQLWCDAHAKHITSITLTASGGPFLRRPLEQFATITPKEAVAHPNWDMGAKISVDSATMANKALELIEAHYLFDIAPEKLDAVIHPQSLVHAFISYADGSTLCHMAPPDMRVPIAAALAWPERIEIDTPPLSIDTLGALQFTPIDAQRFPLFFTGCEALKAGQASMIAFNAANEVVVGAFLEGALPFTGIARIINTVMEQQTPSSLSSLEDVMAWDQQCRTHALQHIRSPYGMAG
jgi:1-deoxy-D-xylulose-5-phosphate reductoisomerase